MKDCILIKIWIVHNIFVVLHLLEKTGSCEDKICVAGDLSSIGYNENEKQKKKV